MISIGRFASSAVSLVLGFALLALPANQAHSQDAAAAAAAAAAPVCDVNETSPAELQRAFLALQSAMTADTSASAKLRHVKNVMMHATTNIEKGVNLPGRNLTMAKALYIMANVKGFPMQTTRGELGFTTTPAGEVDIFVALDSLFSSVESTNPSCVSEIHVYRFSPIWVDLLTQATAALDSKLDDSTERAKMVDSAEKLVQRAQILEKKTPYTWQMLASIATRRNQSDKAIELWKKTYDAAGNDTSMTDVKFQALYFMGEINLGVATSKTGAEAKAPAMESAKWFRQFLTEAGKHKDAPAARANLATALMTAGDSASIPSVYADLLAKPTEFTAQDHLQAGVAADKARKPEDAVKLFGHALERSPFDRDALFNLSVSMFTAKMFTQMVDPARRLVEVDPNNPDNHELLVYAYAMLESTEADAAKKKSFSDSLAKYNPEYERVKASHKVTYAMFDRRATAAALVGEVQNLGAAERSFKLAFDFIDKAGNVIGQGEATVGPVKPTEKARFDVKLERPDIVAFKAKPIPPG